MTEAIHMAIIPMAGIGKRMGPLTRVVPKALLPLVLPDGSVRPVADVIAREALAAGCQRICFVTSDCQEEMLREYFRPETEFAGRLEFVGGVEPFGFGYAVHVAADLAEGQSVMVLLGDHVHLPQEGFPPPAAQVAQEFHRHPAAAMIGVQPVGQEDLPRVGVCGGDPVGGSAGGDVFRCRAVIEKPDLATARRELTTPGLPPGQFLAHAGIYVFSPEIFDCLEELVDERVAGREVGLTEAQQMLLARHPDEYFLRLIRGSTHDTGNAEGYVETINAVRKTGKT
jgi:UTP--glucose-1-phosphate uridylyltransferase